MSTEVIANSVDEVVKLETITLNEKIDELQIQCENHVLESQKNRENNIKSAVARFRGKIKYHKLVIRLAKYYWIFIAIIFALLGVAVGQVKGILGCGGVYIVLTVINKIFEKAFSKNSWGDMLISKSVKWVWRCYSITIKNGLFDFEKDLEKDIMIACIENDDLLLKYQQYCK